MKTQELRGHVSALSLSVWSEVLPICRTSLLILCWRIVLIVAPLEPRRAGTRGTARIPLEFVLWARAITSKGLIAACHWR